MKRSNLPWILSPLFVFLFIFLTFGNTTKVNAAANHIVISQIQSGAGNNDFVELYNPTSTPVDLTGWRVTHKAAGVAGAGTSFIADGLTGTISAHGYYLIANDSGSASPSADKLYGTGFGNNNTIQVFSDNKVTLIDKVGFGTNTDPENTATNNPANGGSIIRKIDDTGGNGLDTDNNSNDFQQQVVANPRNSTVIITPTQTPTNTPTPTDTPTPTATPTPTLTETPTPTISLTPTATPSPTITETPTQTPSPTPTNTMTPTPTATTTPTLTPTPSSTPTATLTPTKTPTTPTIPTFKLTCSTKMLDINVGPLKFHIPLVTCALIKI